MSMVSEQVKKIRSVAGICTIEVKKTLLEAADTIEALSAKLQAENMENVGGWIACKVMLPEEPGNYLCTMWSGEVMVCEYGWNCTKTKKDFFRNYCAASVIAWQLLPEPYVR